MNPERILLLLGQQIRKRKLIIYFRRWEKQQQKEACLSLRIINKQNYIRKKSFSASIARLLRRLVFNSFDGEGFKVQLRPIQTSHNQLQICSGLCQDRDWKFATYLWKCSCLIRDTSDCQHNLHRP